MKLKDKVALITGSSRGIGRATALLFAREGAKIIVNYSKSQEEAEEVVYEIKRLGSDAIAVKCNVANQEEVKVVVDEAIRKFGRIDILVNNAGVARLKSLSELTTEDWERILGVNLIGVFLCCQAVAPHMQQQRYGKIVNVSSIRGIDYCGKPGVYEYSASKAAVNNFTRTLAKELAPDVNVNCVAPGWVLTDLNKNVDTEYRKSEEEQIYLKRFAQPEEIANAILFFASDEASYVTGQVLPVDGGYILK